MYSTQVAKTESGKYKLAIYEKGKVVYESGEKSKPEQALRESLSFMYRGPNVAAGGSGDGSGNGRRRKPYTHVDANDYRM